ncbi:MAG: shikimate dehydrogenase [Chloroflexia bacterium]
MWSGSTERVGLIGWPIRHSLSPAMHNAAFSALGMDWCYIPLPVHPSRLPEAVRGLVALGFRGANVTVPHKETVLPLVTRLSEDAWALGAVNTLVVLGDDPAGPSTIVGENTDHRGFLAALERAGWTPGSCRHGVVVGAGGAARAVVYALRRACAARITLLNRSLERASSLAADLDPQIEVLPLAPETLVECARRADLLVQATPVGMWPKVQETLWPEDAPIPRDLFVFDLVYNPPETRLVQQARNSGAQAFGGLEMLIEQGARSFALWTGCDPPIDVMRAACRRALQEVQR